ncbi:MAG: sugar phosphate isomerase/epimerase family protein [Eubacteriales bacterium]|jgi:sugar phosphate isomerase/epimerase
MKLVVENYTVRRLYGDLDSIRIIAEAGFDGIDYSFYKLPTGDDLLHKPDLESFAGKIKEAAAEHAVSLCQAHAPFAYTYGEGYDSDNYLDILKSLKVASALGIPHIVVHAVKPVPNEVDIFEYNRDYYRSFIPYCEEYGIKIAVENLFIKAQDGYHGLLHTPSVMTEFVKSLGSDCFITCLDIGHTALTGLAPEDYIRGMSPDLLHALHVQDNDYKGDRHWVPYFGKLNWAEITKALGEIGYRGDFTLEILHFLDRYPPELLPEALKLAAETGKFLIKQIIANKILS